MKSLLRISLALMAIQFFSCKSQPGNFAENPPAENNEWDKYAIPDEYQLNRRDKTLSAIKNRMSERSPDDFFNRQWVNQGPANIGGRVSALAVNPKNSQIIFMGFSNGGLFRTTNGGKNWTPVFDREITLSIGAIAVDPVNTEIIYAGTGDPDINGNSYIGNGLFKSTDGGNTWSSSGLNEVRVINEIIIDPANPLNIYVGAMGNPFEPNGNRGVYKSTDGGKSWTRSLYVSDSAGITDIAIHPGDANIIYAASFHRIRTATLSRPEGPDSKIFRSVDGGKNWTPIMQGINQSVLSRIAIDISTSNPNILYARTVLNSNNCNGGYNMEGFYQSVNGGDSWKRVNVDFNTLDCGFLGGFGWYFGEIAINPWDPQDIFMPGVRLWRSRDGGITWTSVDNQANISLHADKHALVFLNNGDMLLGTDGGLYKYSASTGDWADIENIPCTQFYRVELDAADPTTYYGGAQDNGTSYGNIGSFGSWIHTWGGDGFQTRFHSQHKELVWFETQYGGLSLYNRSNGNTDGFTRGLNGTSNWDAPYFLSPHQEDSMYFGTMKVFANTNPYSANWTGISPDLTAGGPFPTRITPTVSCIDESPLMQHKLMAGTTNGNVWLGNATSKSWQNITQGLPAGYVTAVRLSPTNAGTLYVSFSNYRNNDNTGYLFRSDNDGLTWRNLGKGNLADQPVNDFIIIPDTGDKVIVAGTVFGVYATVDGGENWKRLGSNMPIIPVNAVRYFAPRKEIIAATFARSMQTYTFDDFTTLASDPSVKFEISPNPVSEIIHMKSGDSDSFSNYEIFNNEGALIESIKLNSAVLHAGHLQQGLYYLRITDKSGRKGIRKFIKM